MIYGYHRFTKNRVAKTVYAIKIKREEITNSTKTVFKNLLDRTNAILVDYIVNDNQIVVIYAGKEERDSAASVIEGYYEMEVDNNYECLVPKLSASIFEEQEKSERRAAYDGI